MAEIAFPYLSFVKIDKSQVGVFKITVLYVRMRQKRFGQTSFGKVRVTATHGWKPAVLKDSLRTLAFLETQVVSDFGPEVGRA